MSFSAKKKIAERFFNKEGKRMTAENKTVEKVRNFWNSRPCNISHSPKLVGTAEYFEEVRQRKYFVEKHIPPFAEFGNWRGKEVLEIGCGIGTDTAEFALNGAEITAVDLSEKSVELTKQRLKIFNLPGNILVADTERLSEFLSPKPYDLIYSFGVVHHTPNINQALREIRKFCGPNTELRIMLYSKWSWKVLWIILKYGHGKFWQWRQLVANYSEAQEGSPVSYVFSKNDIRRLLAENGFEAIKISKGHIFPYLISDYKKYKYTKVWYFRIMPPFIFRILEKSFGWHLLVIARPIEI